MVNKCNSKAILLVLVCFTILFFFQFQIRKNLDVVNDKFQTATKQDWVELFPTIKRLLSEPGLKDNLPSISYTTSPNFTLVFLKRKQQYLVGDTIEAVIEARDFHKNPKKYGGDFFRVNLRGKKAQNNGVSCEVEDFMSGKYKVLCPLLWSGPAQLDITLVHPSESVIMLIRNSSGSREPGVTLKAKVKNTKTGKVERVPCAFSFADIMTDSQICNLSNPRNGDPWFCVRPSSRDCPPILWVEHYYDKANDQTLGNKTNFKQGVNWRVPVGESPYKINGAKNKDLSKFKLGPCLEATKSAVPHDPSAPTGWFSNGKWNSLLCRNSPFNSKTMQRCLQNHTLYFTGDSTVRFWYRFLIGAIGANDEGTNAQTAVWAQARNGFDPKYNITLHYRAHGPPLHNRGPMNVRPYITDTMGTVGPNAANTVFVFSIGLHMDLFHPKYYLHRVKGIRNAVIELKKRSPSIRFFVKGLHAHAASTRICPSDWYSYRHDRILRHVFRDVDGVVFLPYWDMTAVLDNKVLHPPTNILRLQMGLLQSFLCPS